MSTLHPALEDWTERGFRNVGKPQSDAGKIPKRIHTSLNYIHLSQFAHHCLRNISLTPVVWELQQFVVQSKHRCDKPLDFTWLLVSIFREKGLVWCVCVLALYLYIIHYHSIVETLLEIIIAYILTVYCRDWRWSIMHKTRIEDNEFRNGRWFDEGVFGNGWQICTTLILEPQRNQTINSFLYLLPQSNRSIRYLLASSRS